MHSPSIITIPHDALLVLSRAKNSNLYGRLTDSVARRKPVLHMCNGVNFRDEYLCTAEIRDVIDDRSARVLAVMDAPAQDFCDYPVLTAIHDLKRFSRASLDLALVIDTEWSNSIKSHPAKHKAKPPFDFPDRPELYRDRDGPAQLMEEVRIQHPDITQLHVTDATITDALKTYFQSLI